MVGIVQVLFDVAAAALVAHAGASGGAVDVGPGVYRPMFPASPSATTIEVPAFALDRDLVTNGQFLAFVREQPRWRRDRIAPVMAEPTYLDSWATPEALGAGVDPMQPVVRVSWFAARAYCAGRGGRLPTEAEWELAANASRTRKDGASDAAWRVALDDRYARPMPSPLPRVASEPPNAWGVRDLHTIWEWVEDYDGSLRAADDGAEPLRFCAGAGGTAGDKTDFGAFERAALRNSLRASYALPTLGFRCAYDREHAGGAS